MLDATPLKAHNRVDWGLVMSLTSTAGVTLAVLSLVSINGCARMVAGFDGQINLKVDQWTDVIYGYLSIESEPADAIVSVQATYSFHHNASAGVDVRSSDTNEHVTEWGAIGSTPIENFKVSMRGKGRQGQLGTSVNVVFTLTHLDVRIEMPGYEPYELKNVVPGTEGQARFRVTLVEAETES